MTRFRQFVAVLLNSRLRPAVWRSQRSHEMEAPNKLFTSRILIASGFRLADVTGGVVVRRLLCAMKTIIATVLLVLLVICNGCCLFEPIAIKTRHPMTVALRVQDTNGIAQAGVRFRFGESGWRHLSPFPFTSAWTVKGPVHEAASDTTGALTVTFHEDYLDLEQISTKGQAVTNFMTVFYRFDGHCFTNQYHSYHWTLQYGCYPKAKDPMREDYTITIK